MTDPDDLEPLLAPHPTPGLRPGFDAELFARTERALARDRRLRRAGRLAGLVGVFVFGGLAGWGIRPEPQQQITTAVRSVEVVTVPVIVPVPVPGESSQ